MEAADDVRPTADCGSARAASARVCSRNRLQHFVFTSIFTRSRVQTQTGSALEAQVRAIRSKDARAALADCAPDFVRYDLAPPLATPGAPAAGARLVWTPGSTPGMGRSGTSRGMSRSRRAAAWPSCM